MRALCFDGAMQSTCSTVLSPAQARLVELIALEAAGDDVGSLTILACTVRMLEEPLTNTDNDLFLGRTRRTIIGAPRL